MAVPRASTTRRGTRSQAPRAGLTPRSGAHATIGGETFPPTAPTGPAPANVLRDNQDLFPRATQSYQRSTAAGRGPDTPWRFAPSTPLQPAIRGLVAEAAGVDISDPLKRQMATLSEDEQRSLIAGSQAAGLPQTDNTYARLLSARVTDAITPGTPQQNRLEQIALDHAPPGSDEDLRNFADAVDEVPDNFGLPEDQQVGASIRDALDAGNLSIAQAIYNNLPSESLVPGSYTLDTGPSATTPNILPTFIAPEATYDDLRPTGSDTEQPVEAAGGD